MFISIVCKGTLLAIANKQMGSESTSCEKGTSNYVNSIFKDSDKPSVNASLDSEETACFAWRVHHFYDAYFELNFSAI